MNKKEKRIRNEKQKNKFNNKKLIIVIIILSQQANMDCMYSY